MISQDDIEDMSEVEEWTYHFKTPDNWVVLKIAGKDPHYRILAGWSGGYLDGDSWKLNSGIVPVFEHKRSFKFVGFSKSVYLCSKLSYGLRMNNSYVWEKLKKVHGDKISIMPVDTDWVNMDWIIK